MFYVLTPFDKRDVNLQALAADSDLHLFRPIQPPAAMFFPTLMFVLCPGVSLGVNNNAAQTGSINLIFHSPLSCSGRAQLWHLRPHSAAVPGAQK